MAYTKIALFAAIAALASAQTQDEINELNVILNDVKSHLQEYMSLAQDPSSGFSLSSMPAGVLDIGMALASATDDSYTTLYSKVDFAGVSKMLTMVPWYSSRLEPALKSLDGDATSTAAPSSSAAKSSSAAPSSSEAKSSSAAPSSTEAKTTSAAPSSTGAKTSAISQITDGQIQATKAVSEQTKNGAAKAFVGMGAGVVAAAAMLL
ncbi:cold shock-induced protein TIR1 [Saccharomyces cerevisiae]|nr:cold shock-induced protein TIR1 [Saccharomyces cerevisiae]